MPTPQNFFLKLAIADAYGMGFEFMPQEIVEKENNLSSYRKHGKHSELDPGQYTDDTQMTIALFDSLVHYRYAENSDLEVICNKEVIADYFVSTFKRDPRKGYAKGFQSVLEKVQNGKELIETIEAYGKTESNGACMRAIPAGLFFDQIESMLAFSKAQAEITHQGNGVLAAQAVSLTAWILKNDLYDCRLEYLPDALNTHLQTNIDWSWDGSRVASKDNLGMDTAKAAIHTLMTTTSYSECLRKAVSYGGDTDSVAAIACGLSSLCASHRDQAIPEPLLNGFERGAFGFGFLFNKA